MFGSKEANNEIEKLHRRVLLIIHDDFSYSYDDLRMKDNSATIHVCNLQFLMTEIFEMIHDENPPFIKEVFVMEEFCYNLRSKFRLHVPAGPPPQNMVWKQYLSEAVKSGMPILMTLTYLRTTVPLVSSYIRNSLRFWYYASLSTCCQNLEKNWGHRENLGESGGQTFKCQF